MTTHGLVFVYPRDVTNRDAPAPDALANLSEAERAFVDHSESLWRRAHIIAAEHAGLDAGDVYHAHRCLELEPA